MEVQFLDKYKHKSMEIDALVSSRPLIQEANDPGEICELFDIISSGKGASILRMLELYMGPKHFQMGMQEYIKNHTYGHTVTADLWEIMETVPEKKLPIGRIMDSWTKQIGYPVLTVEKVGDDNYRLSQERFLRNPASARKSQETSRWNIPITYTCSNKPKIMMELMDKERFRNILFRNIPSSSSLLHQGNLYTVFSTNLFYCNKNKRYIILHHCQAFVI